MLSSQDFRGRHQHRLTARRRYIGHGQHGHHRLARAYVALDQARHALAAGEIAADLGQGARLGARQPVRQGGLHPPRHLAGRYGRRGFRAAVGLALHHGELMGEQLVIGQPPARRGVRQQVHAHGWGVQGLQRGAPGGPGLARQQVRVDPLGKLRGSRQRGERQPADRARGKASGGGIDRLVRWHFTGAVEGHEVIGMDQLQLGVEPLRPAAGDPLGAHRVAALKSVAEHLEPAQESEARLVGHADAVGMAGPAGRLVGVDAHAQRGDLPLLHLGDPPLAPVHEPGWRQEQQVAHPLASQLDHQRPQLGAEALQRAHVGEQGEEDLGAHDLLSLPLPCGRGNSGQRRLQRDLRLQQLGYRAAGLGLGGELLELGVVGAGYARL